VKVKKLYSYNDNKQIWRLQISNTDKLIIETRDTNNKEVFFNCIQIESGKNVFINYQFEEKFWIGIEEIYKDIIFLHKFNKPDLPGHKQIIAFDINSQKIIWENRELSFLFILHDKIYAYKQNFEERNYYEIDYRTGKIINDLNSDVYEINKLNEIAAGSKDFSNYIFPQKFDKTQENGGVIKEIILKEIQDLEIVGNVEYNKFESLLLMNHYSKTTGSLLLNKFKIFNSDNKKEILCETLNSNANAFVPDSFFVYLNYLILLIEKNKLIVYELK